MGNKETKQDIKQLYDSATKLEKEGYDIWENEPRSQGHGFKVILKDTWVEVWLSIFINAPSKVFAKLCQKSKEHPNVLDSFTCKELASEETTDLSKVYDIVKKLIETKPAIELDFEDLAVQAINTLIEQNGGSLETALDDMKEFDEEKRKAIKEWFNWD